MRRIVIPLMLALTLVGAACGGQSDQPSAAPATAVASMTTTAPPATLASTTTGAPSRARQLQSPQA